MSAPITDRCDSSRRSLVRRSMSFTDCSSSLRARTSLLLAMYSLKLYQATASGRVKTTTPKTPRACEARARAAPCAAVARKFTGIQL